MADPKYEDTTPFAEETPKYEDTVPHFESSTQETNEDDPQLSEALLRKTGQGLTAGWMDEGVAGVQAGMDVATSDKKMSDLHQLYQTYKELQNDREKQVAEKYPKISMAAEIAGSIPTAFTGLGAANTLSKAVKLGGLYGLGKSEADLTSGDPSQLVQGAQDTATGGVLGYGGYKIAPLIGKAFNATGIPGLFQKAGQGLKTEAGDLSLSALGTSKKLQQVEHGGYSGADTGFRKGIGEEAYNSIGMTGGAGKVRQVANNKISELESLKTPLIEEAHNKLQNTINSGAVNNLVDTAGESLVSNKLLQLKDSIINKTSKATTDISKVQGIDDKLTETLQRYSVDDYDIKALNELKKAIGDELGDKAFQKQALELPEQAEFLKGAYTIVKERIEKLAEHAGPGLGQKIKELNNSQFINMKLRDAAFESELSKAANTKWIGPGDFIAYGAGHAFGGIPGGVGALAAKKGLERSTGWGTDQLAKIGAAKVASGAGKLVTATGNAFNALQNPNVVQAGLRSTAETVKPLEMSQKAYTATAEELSGAAQKLMTNPQFQSYGKALQDALSNNDPEKKNAVIFTILQNPNMRSFINDGQ